MHRITKSIIINLPAERVFSFLKDIEGRLRLNPFYNVIAFQKITEGEVGVGSRFRIVIVSGDRRSEYISEVIEYVENRKIVSHDTEGRLRLTLTTEPAAGGTRLTHDEEFVIPLEFLSPQEEDADVPVWMKVLRWFIAFEGTGFSDREKEEKIEKIKDRLRANLKTWLLIIKRKIEEETS